MFVPFDPLPAPFDPCLPVAGFLPPEDLLVAEPGAEELFWTDGAVTAGGAASVVDVVGVVGVVGVEVVPATGAHDSDNPRIGNFTGSDNDDNGVPGGTSSVNDRCAPPTNVTVTVHSCATAGDGTAANPTTSAPAATATPNSLLLLKSTLPVSRTCRLYVFCCSGFRNNL